MSFRKPCSLATAWSLGTGLLAIALLVCVTEPSLGGLQLARNRSVGGVMINPAGVLGNLDLTRKAELKRLREEALREVPDGAKQSTKLRKVSLAGLIAAIEKANRKSTEALPDHIRFVAGLQRIQYVFVDPKKNDIVLVGPAEGWKVGENGDIVGISSGKPVLHLDDLLAALRVAATPNRDVISCSIDPTDAGRRGLRAFLKTMDKRQAARNPEPALKKIEQAMGPQVITVEGIDTSSRFARVLVAADYRLKRLAMGHDKVPIRGMSSYIAMMRGGRSQNMMPRWWLEDNYQALATDGDGLAFELRGKGVKAMTEEEFISEEGKVKGTGRVDKTAKKWADTMTDKYDDLSGKAPIFGELRNCMDLSVVAALILTENLHGKAGLDLSPLLDSSNLATTKYPPARYVPTQANSVKIRGNTAITASGGVQINPWNVVAKEKTKSESLAPLREKSLSATRTEWYWN